VGASRQGTLPDETRVTLAAEALRNALDDAGLEKDEIDGLLTMPGTSSPEGPRHYLALGEHFGINPRIAGTMVMGGATASTLVQNAALAINAGMASVVACVFSDTARTSGSRFAGSAGWGDPWGIWGMFSAAANSAIDVPPPRIAEPQRRAADADDDRRPPQLADDRRPAAP
jgi:acetyl-CoA acetyltransferase